MKKRMRIVAWLLVALLCFSMSACVRNHDENKKPADQNDAADQPFVPKDMEALWNKIDEQMEALKSYEVSQIARVTMYQSGNRFETVSKVRSQLFEDREYNEWSNSVKCEALAMNETVNSMSAYYDGTMYVSNKSDRYDQRFCAETTFEQYQTLQDSSISSDDVDFMDCTSAEFEQKNDGTWSAHLSGYTKKVIQSLTKQFGITEDSLGAAVLDAEIDLTATAEFCVKDMNVRFVFDVDQDDDVEPCFSIEATYSNYDKAQFDTQSLHKQEYTKVPDLSVLYMVEKELNALKSVKKGQFALGVTTITEVFGETQTSRETDNVTYGMKNGAYYYTVTGDVDGKKVTLRYENGIQTVQSGSDSQSTAVSQEESKAFIDHLINYPTYNRMAVTDIQQQDADHYRLKVKHYDTSSFRDAYSAGGIQLSEAEQDIEVTIENKRLSKLDSEIRMSGIYTYGSQSAVVTITIRSSNTYEVTADSAVLA